MKQPNKGEAIVGVGESPSGESTRLLIGLGPLEAQVMEILWEMGEGTVGEVAERVANGKRPAYTTIMTIMSRLFEKGLLVREFRGRAYLYRPVGTKADVLARAAQTKVRSLVRDFGDFALAQFMEEIEKADPQRRRRLSELLSQRGRK